MIFFNNALFGKRVLLGTLNSLYLSTTSTRANDYISGSVIGAQPNSVLQFSGNATSYISFGSAGSFGGSFSSAGTYQLNVTETNPDYEGSPKVSVMYFSVSAAQITLGSLSVSLPNPLRAGQSYSSPIYGGQSGSSYYLADASGGYYGGSANGASISLSVYGGGTQGASYSFSIYEYNSNASNSGRGTGFSYSYTY